MTENQKRVQEMINDLKRDPKKRHLVDSHFHMYLELCLKTDTLPR